MTDSRLPEDVAVHNERSLQKLAWAIANSQGKFKLILARCNYISVREQIGGRLRELVSGDIRILRLKESDKTLYATIRVFLGEDVPDALMVFGLESVRDLERLLTSANQVREEFRKNFPFPIVLWVSDQVQQQLMRLATDFESWATTIKFAFATNELLDFLRQIAEQFFGDHFTPTLQACDEIKLACLDLQSREQVLDLELRASLESLLGFTASVDYAKSNLDAALEHYQRGWELWQQSHNLERQGKLLSEIAIY